MHISIFLRTVEVGSYVSYYLSRTLLSQLVLLRIVENLFNILVFFNFSLAKQSAH